MTVLLFGAGHVRKEWKKQTDGSRYCNETYRLFLGVYLFLCLTLYHFHHDNQLLTNVLA